MTLLQAPWTAAQVDALNRLQRHIMPHPYTCPGHEGDGARDLVATRNGWICCHCDYKQDWAHPVLVEGEWTTT